MIRHYHNRSALLFALLVESNLLHACWTQRLGNEPCRVLIPLDDVNLLALELIDNLTDTRSSRSDTSPNGINVVIVGGNGDLGPMTSLSRDGLDLDVPVHELRNLELKKGSDEFGMAARHDDLRTFTFAPNLENPRLDPVSAFETFVGDLL